MKHLDVFIQSLSDTLYIVFGRGDFPLPDDWKFLPVNITKGSIALPEALQAANTVIFSWPAHKVILLATSPFGAIILHLPASVGKPDSSRFHICEERNEFEAADFCTEDIMLVFFKLILLCFIKLLTHFLPGLLFLKGVLSLFDSTYSYTISLI